MKTESNPYSEALSLEIGFKGFIYNALYEKDFPRLSATTEFTV
jgi:hypothetical protein